MQKYDYAILGTNRNCLHNIITFPEKMQILVVLEYSFYHGNHAQINIFCAKSQ